ncbi:MAG TPA: triphosphoribosyl-dephospho-CoA synthase [Candidatus Polarisedimenticolia bacterium]
MAERRASRRIAAPPRAGGGGAESAAAAAQIACLLDVAAPKPGNVSRGRDLPGLTYRDLVLSATAIGPAFRDAGRRRVGDLVLDAIRRTRRVVDTNTNLGIVLLLAPLARAAARRGPAALRRRLAAVLGDLDLRDARLAYRAIRLAGAGGLGRVPAQDVARAPTGTLLACMRLAAGRDAVAREYATGFRTTFTISLPTIRRLRARRLDPARAIAQTFLTILAGRPDTLIARRHGTEAAERASREAASALRAGGMLTARGRRKVAALDRRLRASRPPQNPGATADLTVAGLMALLLESRPAARRGGAKRSRRRG